MSSVCVHGLGYIGLPTAAMLATHGHDVYGYDTDSNATESVRNGDVHLDEPGLDTFVARALTSGRLDAVDEIHPAEYHVICVPTPFDAETRQADLEYVRASARAISTVLREKDTVIVESTVPPGTTERTVEQALEGSGLVAGRDFHLAFCPETVLPGNVIAELRENDRIVGGIDQASTDSAVRLYESFVEGDIRTASGSTTAEFIKLIQNTARDVNVALANEIARVARDYGVDSREAIEMANAHPRVDILRPGPGVGGHCLPVDPWFLGTGSDQLELISTARSVNDGMVDFVIELVEDLVSAIDDGRIAVFGAAYKGNVDDTRNSPGLALARELRYRSEQSMATADGGTPGPPSVAVHDPHVTDPTLDLCDAESATTDAHALVIATDHSEFAELDPARIRKRMAEPNVVDAMGVLDRDSWIDAGFAVRRV